MWSSFAVGGGLLLSSGGVQSVMFEDLKPLVCLSSVRLGSLRLRGGQLVMFEEIRWLRRARSCLHDHLVKCPLHFAGVLDVCLETLL